jgi:hypothetical protein
VSMSGVAIKHPRRPRFPIEDVCDEETDCC